MNPDFSILDNHIHLDPEGLGVEGAKRFEQAGGSHLILVHKPYHHIDREDFGVQFETTLGLAEKVRSETGLVVYTALSPHPAELTRLMEKYPLEKAKEMMLEAIELAGKHVREGRALAFGEVGRPHYPVEEYVWEASNDLILYTLELAKELDCAVQFHTEGGRDSFRDIAGIAKKVGYPLERCVKHFSGPAIEEKENFGLFPSVVSRKGSIKKAIAKGNRFFMETDYIDELSRPNAVLSPDTVPKLTLEFLRKGIFSEEDVLKIHRENPERVYGIEMEKK
ncbi:MAG: TatD family hydrolase [Thermoplasmata archaeon]|nr:TatD family hydrolase [Thermoplasmata archaeon]